MESRRNHNYTLLNTEVTVQYLLKKRVQGRTEGEKQPCFENKVNTLMTPTASQQESKFNQ